MSSALTHMTMVEVADAISKGDVKIDGSRAKLEEMLSYLDTFEFWFKIVTP